MGNGAIRWRGRVARCAALAVTLFVAACGGGGGGGNASSGTPSAPSPPATPPAPPAPAETSITFATALTPGWNLGNALESLGSASPPAATSQETAYGNPPVTQAVLNAVAAAGFKSVRIPVSWAQYADSKDEISAAWLTRVAQVVDYARNAGLNVIINIHYDGGWMQPTAAQQAYVDARITKFWTQIATKFKDYDTHLLFAGTNEVMVTNVYSAPTAENCSVQNGFNQAFVNAVRATGGNNATRYLIVQGYNTNIDYTVSCNATLPTDSTADHLMMEVHFYDPYDFTLNAGSTIWQWGANATDPSATEAYANEAYVDAEFEKMDDTFVKKGVPVILGEYSAILRTEYDPAGTYRTAWDTYVASSARAHGMVPFYWDNGDTTNHGLGLFDRSTGAEAYKPLIDAVVSAGQ